MRVNRIYFRGVKTFQGVFAFSLFLTTLPGCANMGKFEVRAVPVARSPRIVDLEISGACQEAQVVVRNLGKSVTLPVAYGRQITKKQGGKPVYRARFDLGSIAQLNHDGSKALTIEIQCPTHGQEHLVYSVADNLGQDLITPDWAKGLVWYQVFPERFRDKNPNNNQNAWDVTPVEWDTPFGEVQIDDIERAWSRRLVDTRAFSYNGNHEGGAISSLIFDRRFGGDLIGLYSQLESLKAQGYTGIYLCPIFQSRSLHKYDADDHRHIDPALGHPGVWEDQGPGHTRLGQHEDPSDETTWGWTPADRWFLDEFLPKAKSLGLKIVLDGVWNHVGTDHFAFADLRENGVDSPFADWFEAEFDEQGKLFAWQGWGGSVNGSLPEFQQTPTGDLVAGPKAHIMAVTRRWLDPNGDGDPSDGIDGWRLDVAGEIGKPFWKDWREQVRSVNPDALIIAEIWNDAGNMFHDEGFDGQMNYPVAYALANWLSIGHAKGDAQACAQLLNSVFNHEPEHDLVQFNLMASHDTERLASMMHNQTPRNYDNDSSRWRNTSTYDPMTVNDDDRHRALAAIAAMVALPGSVMMYNGDEFAMAGGDDPDNRRPIPWGVIEADEPNCEALAYLTFQRAVNELIGLRSEPVFEQVLRFGDSEFIGNDDGSLFIRRQLGDRRVEFLIPKDSLASETDAWPASDSRWSEQSETSRKIRLRAGMSGFSVRLMVASGGVDF